MRFAYNRALGAGELAADAGTGLQTPSRSASSKRAPPRRKRWMNPAQRCSGRWAVVPDLARAP